MPRKPSLNPPLKPLPDGAWCVRIAGQRYRLGSDREIAEQRRRRLLADWIAGGCAAPPAREHDRQAPTDLSVAEAVLAYLRHQEKEVGAKQLERCRAMARILCEFCGATRAADFDKKTLRAFREHLIRRESRRGGSELLSRIAGALAGGPMPAGELDRLLAAEGHDQVAVARARGRLGLRARRVAGRWVVALPEGYQPPARKPLSRRYVNALAGCVKACFWWLESEDLVPPGTGQGLRAVKALKRGKGGREMPPVMSVPLEFVELTLPHLREDLAAMVRLQLAAGMRPGELCAMRVRDLSRDPAHRIAVPLGDDRTLLVGALEVNGILVWVYVPESHKTAHRGRPRVVPLGPVAQAILAPLLAGLGPDDHVFSPRRSVGALRDQQGRSRRCGRQPAERWSTESYGQVVERAAARAGAPHWTPNQLRHAKATEANEEFDLESAAALLGHARPDTTLVYAELAIKKAATVAARLG